VVLRGPTRPRAAPAPHAGEYVNVYHATDYVRATWGRYFDVVHVLPGYILHHDLVMLRKR
jgi:hypothetical protein